MHVGITNIINNYKKNISTNLLAKQKLELKNPRSWHKHIVSIYVPKRSLDQCDLIQYSDLGVLEPSKL